MRPGRAAPEAVSGRAVTAESWVQSQDSPCEISGGWSVSGSGFSPSTSFFTVLFDSTSVSYYQDTNRWNLGTFQKEMLIRKEEALDNRKIFLYLVLVSESLSLLLRVFRAALQIFIYWN